MAREVPQVVQGSRSAADTGRDGAAAAAANAAPLGRARNVALDAVDHLFEYHSEAGSLFLQLRNPRDQVDQDGNKTVIKGLYLRFRQGRAVIDTDTPEGAEAKARIEGVKPGEDELYPKGLRPHPRFGLGLDFWRADEAADKAKRAAVDAALATVRKAVAENPEILEQVLNDLGSAEFTLDANPAPANESDANVEKP